jgi:hypothetical protein
MVHKLTGLIFAFSALASPALADDVPRQSLNDAWWTGPLLAPSANTLPQGHVLFEPYFFDVVTTGKFDAAGHGEGAPPQHVTGSQSYLNYGLLDRFTVGVIPRFSHVEPASGRQTSGLAFGDVTLQAQYRLTSFHEGSWLPTTSINVGETLPTGRFDRLDRASDGVGSGAYSTSVAVYAQTFFWTPNGRILRTRLDLTWQFGGATTVKDLSVFGTNNGFRGRADEGDSATADLAFEYSATRNWVLAMDLWWERDASTALIGGYPAGPALRSDLGASTEVYLAPALEYNFNGAVGLIAGARIEAAGRNTSRTVAPVAAVNMVF